MSRFVALLFLIGIGFLIGINQSQTLTRAFPRLAAIVQPVQVEDEPAIVRNASEVNKRTWKTSRSDALGFLVQHPSSAAVTNLADSVIITLNPMQTIVLKKFHDRLKPQVTDSMQQGGWKIADRKVYALTTPYFTNNDGTLSSTYLFVRDFPQADVNGRYAMVKATITTTQDDPAFIAARQQGIIDPESVLTLPEQVLSTFRFLALDEIK